MSKFWLVVLGIVSCFALSGCGGVLDSLREESEEAERESRREEAFYNAGSARPRGSRGLSANTISDYGTVEGNRARARADDAFEDVQERVKGAAEETRRRYSRADFVDGQSNENSLWNAQGQSNYYFAQNNRFDNGDLVIVSVDRSLKRDIQYALWKSLPADQRRIKRKPASEDLKNAADKAKQGIKDAGKDAEESGRRARQQGSRGNGRR